MTHREHVIKALEEVIPFIDSRGYGGVAEIMHDALELLNEQEAVPVIQRELMHMIFWCCGSCGVPITDGDKFCRMCGKAVKWNDQKN